TNVTVWDGYYYSINEVYDVDRPIKEYNVSSYINATNLTSDSWLYLNLSYNETYVNELGYDEAGLEIWKYDSSWTQLTAGVNTVENYVYKNITDFSIFGIFGDPEVPKYYNNFTSVSSPLTYYPKNNIGFQINCTDNIGIYNALFEINGNNYSMNNNTPDIFYYNLTDQPASTINYKMYCNDTSGNTNSTSLLTFIITKNTTNPVNLYLNNALNSNKTYTYPESINATAEAIYSNSGTLILSRNETNVGTTIEQIRLGSGTYIYNASISGNTNYTSNESVYYVFVNKGHIATYLSLNETQGNVTYSENDIANITAWSNASIDTLTITLYSNYSGTLKSILQGQNIITNLTNLTNLDIGTYNISANTSGNENYTVSSLTSYLLIINDTTSPIINTFLLSSSSISLGNTITINWNVSDNNNVSRVIITSNGQQIINTTYSVNSTEYTPSTEGTKTILLRAYDDHGNSITDSLLLNVIGESTTGSSVTRPVDITDAKLIPIGTKAKLSLRKNKQNVILFERSKEMPILSVKIIPRNNIYGAELSVKKIYEIKDVEAPSNIVYSYMEMITNNLTSDNIYKSFIKFRVSEEWLQNMNVNSSEIYLMRYYNNTWVKLKTSKIGRKEGYIYYEAETEGFSYFAIVAIEHKQQIKSTENVFDIPIQIITNIITKERILYMIISVITAVILYIAYILYKLEKEVKILKKKYVRKIKDHIRSVKRKRKK
ncbi:MAG: PGF-pre-PGF domain-containing protein, partial [Candidatus Aenigmarchaeota archaeon]|nr:PGF-pre-PGF domain-containing protein [Candidatus Aenigmarchaeota archaeon]